MVMVGPPLSCSGPSLGLVLFRSPEPLKLQEPSLLRLWPFELTLFLKQFPPELFATILFWSVAPPALKMPPPPTALFPLIVPLLIFRGPLLVMPPPNAAPFPLIVLLLIFRCPQLEMPPPTPAPFPLKVLL